MAWVCGLLVLIEFGGKGTGPCGPVIDPIVYFCSCCYGLRQSLKPLFCSVVCLWATPVTCTRFPREPQICPKAALWRHAWRGSTRGTRGIRWRRRQRRREGSNGERRTRRRQNMIFFHEKIIVVIFSISLVLLWLLGFAFLLLSCFSFSTFTLGFFCSGCLFCVFVPALIAVAVAVIAVVLFNWQCDKPNRRFNSGSRFNHHPQWWFSSDFEWEKKRKSLVRKLGSRY